MKNTTLKDLAKILNLSVSTVSKALNDSSEISKITKNRVKEAALKCNYRPNPIALNLKIGRSKTIGVVIPSVLDRFSAKLFIGIEKVAHARGYNAMLCTSNYSTIREAENMDILSDKGVDGIIVSLADETIRFEEYAHIEKAIAMSYSLVLTNKVPERLNTNKISVDFYQEAFGAVKAVEISMNAKVLVIGAVDNKIYFDKRKEGVLDALSAEHNITTSKLMAVEEGANYIQDVVAEIESQKINFIIALNQGVLKAITANKFIKELLDAEKLRVYGFSNRRTAFEGVKGVTTISQRGKYLGEKSAELLIDQIELMSDDNSSQTIVVDSIKKKSTRI